MTKSENMPVWLSKFAHFAVARNRRNNQWYAPAEKSVINMIDVCSIFLIGPP
jgi:hypothetical protein